MKNIKFVTLFPNCPNYGLVKDVGQIPYILGRDIDDIEAELVSCKLDLNGPNISEVIGLKLSQIDFFINDTITGILYLLRNAKRITWLNIYHCGKKAMIWNKVYKLLNPQGKTYLKLDLDYISCDMYDHNARERRLFKKVTEEMDLVSVESTTIRNRIQKYTRKELKLISNGYCELSKPIDITRERSNTFITVGRLGTEQKATDMLLEAFAESADEHDWKLKLIGDIEKGFELYINDYYRKYPKLQDRVIFVGNISDREELYDNYSKAKVFVLPSRWESFALVGPEAISCGCRIIITDAIPIKNVVTNSCKYGKIIPVDDKDALCFALIEATRETYSAEHSVEIAKYASSTFSWGHICKELFAEMCKI